MQDYVENETAKNIEAILKLLQEEEEEEENNLYNLNIPILYLKPPPSFVFYEGTLDKAKTLLRSAILHLFNVKCILKEDNEIYLNLSTRVASKAQHYIIRTINCYQITNHAPQFLEQFSTHLMYEAERRFFFAWDLTQLIGSLDMTREFHQNYTDNKLMLEKHFKQLHFGYFISKNNYIPVPRLNFIIIDSEITNSDGENNSLLATNPMYNKFARYLGLNIKVIALETETITFTIKYFSLRGYFPDDSFEKIPDTYDFSCEKVITQHFQELHFNGQGNKDKCIYKLGKHKFEVWINGCFIFEKEFTIDLSPSQRIDNQIENVEDELNKIRKTVYFASEIEKAKKEMDEIKKFKFFRGGREKQRQTKLQQQRIDDILKKSNAEQYNEMREQQEKIEKLKAEILNVEY